MVDVTVPAPKLILPEQPKTDITSAVFNRPLPVGVGAGMEQLGAGAEDLAGDLARQQVQSDLQNQKVTIDANGQVQMADPSNSIILGRAGDEYNQAMNVGNVAQLGNDVRTRLQNIQLQYPMDPVGFKKASDDYVSSVRSNTTLGPAVGNSLGNIAASEATRRLDNVTEKSFEEGAKASLGNVQTEIAETTNRMRAIARQGGINTPAYDQLQDLLQDSYDNLKGAGRIFGYSPERADSELNNSLSMDRGEAIVGNVERIFSRTSGDGGRAGAQAYLQQLDDPSLDLPIQERDNLKRMGMAHLEYLTSNQKAQIDASRVGSNAMLDLYRTDPSKVTEQMFNQGMTQAHSVGDAESELKLQWAHDAAPTARALQGLTPEQRVMVGTGNDYVSKLARVEGGNNPTGGNGGGAYQFEPATWQGLMRTHPDLGLTANGRTDPAQESRAIVAFTQDNQKALQAAGVAPTDANLRMAHFLGAGAEPAFLKQMQANPDAPAAGTNLAAATANPTVFYKPGANGKPDPSQPRSYQEVYALQTRGFAGTTPVVAAGVSGAPTAAQQQANPYALPIYVESLKREDDQDVKAARNVGGALDQQFAQGNVPPAETTAAFLQMADKHPNELGEQAQKVRNYYEGAAAGDAINAMPAPQREAYAAQVAGALANPTDLNAMGRAEEIQRVMKKGDANLQADPWPEMVRRGWIAHRPIPLDFSQPQSVPQAFAQRAQAASALASFTGNPAQSMIPPRELPQLKGIVTSGTVDRQVALGQALVGANAQESVLRATLEQLGKDDVTRPLAVAGDVARYAPQVSHDIIAGQQLMQADPKLAPNKDDYPSELAKLLPFNDLPDNEARRNYDAAIQALYAKRSAEKGDTAGVLDQARLEQVVKDVTGGIVDWRGGKAIAPWYGANDDDHAAAINLTKDADLANSRGSDGVPLPAAALQKSFASRLGFGAPWSLQSVDGGKYMIYPNNGTTPRQYLKDVRGGNFILDLGAKRQAVEAQGLHLTAPFSPAEQSIESFAAGL